MTATLQETSPVQEYNQASAALEAARRRYAEVSGAGNDEAALLRWDAAAADLLAAEKRLQAALVDLRQGKEAR